LKIMVSAVLLERHPFVSIGVQIWLCPWRGGVCW
jgi:hypothetical protein